LRRIDRSSGETSRSKRTPATDVQNELINERGYHGVREFPGVFWKVKRLVEECEHLRRAVVVATRQTVLEFVRERGHLEV
jgi:hypothetical protein